MKKKIGFLLAALIVLPVYIFADVCSDLISFYNQKLQNLRSDTEAALSTTTDPALIEAIRLSYQMRYDQITMERDSALTSAGCNSVPLPDPDPIPEPDPDPIPEPDPDPIPEPDPDPIPEPDPDPIPEPDPDPIPEPTPDPNPDPDPVPDPNPTPDPDPSPDPVTCDYDQLDAYAQFLKDQGIHGSQFVHKMKAKITELGCKNYGKWRCRIKKPVSKKVKKKKSCLKKAKKKKSYYKKVKKNKKVRYSKRSRKKCR